MRIYDGDFTVGRLIEQCATAPRRASNLPVPGREPTPEIDIISLNRCLADLPIAEIRRRRRRMNTFYEEVLVSSDPDRGIGFTSLLMILAHHKVINDNKSLRYAQSQYLAMKMTLTRLQVRGVPASSRTPPACRRSCPTQCCSRILRHTLLGPPLPSRYEPEEARPYGYYSTVHCPRNFHRRRGHHERKARAKPLAKRQLTLYTRQHKHTRRSRQYQPCANTATPRHQCCHAKSSQLDPTNTHRFTNTRITRRKSILATRRRRLAIRVRAQSPTKSPR
jgi:hypothetical protein